MKRRTLRGLFVITALIGAAAAGCTDIDPISPGPVDTGSVSFARYAAVGNSLTAGTQSNGLVETYQAQSYGALLAAAARAPQFEMPLISEPGIPPLIFFSQIVPTPVIAVRPGLGVPTNTTYPGIYNNLGIPGANLHDLLFARPGDPNPFFDIVLRDSTLFGPTVVAQAVNLQPTFLTVWVGANDILGSASRGTDGQLTDPALFASDYAALMDALRPAAGAIVAGNLPAIIAIPFFTTVPPFLVDPATRQPVTDPMGNLVPLLGEFQGTSGPLSPASLLTLPASQFLAAGIGVPTAYGGTGLPLPDSVVVDSVELVTIQTRTAEFNTTIDTVCTNRNIPVVDFFGFFNDVRANGIMIRGDEFTADYVTGGLFSVDGVHPSSMGYYLVAQQFIAVINASFGASIPDPPMPLQPPPAGATAFAHLTPLDYAEAVPAGVFEGLWWSLGARRR